MHRDRMAMRRFALCGGMAARGGEKQGRKDQKPDDS